MAVNTLAPNGLLFSRNRMGAAPTYQAQQYYITNGYASKIGVGDLVKTGVGGNQGNVVISAFGDTSGLGVFVTVLPYYDTTFQQTAHGLNGSYPTTAAPVTGTNVPCLVISDFLAVFRVQMSGGPWTASMRGQNINWLTGTNGAPNAAGISTLAVDATTIGTSNTLPFRIENVVGVSGGPQDPANTNPVIEVGFNPNWLESMQGTGI
jgi:hypothetical protein